MTAIQFLIHGIGLFCISFLGTIFFGLVQDRNWVLFTIWLVSIAGTLLGGALLYIGTVSIIACYVTCG